jgi:hypothetical protein
MEKVDLIEMTEKDSLEVIRLLLKSGSEVNAEFGAGNNALFCTMMRRNVLSSWMISSVKLLLAHGASVTSISGITHALHYVRCPQLAQIILNHDASGLNKVDFSGWTVLHYIMAKGGWYSVDLIKYLLKNGARVESEVDFFNLALKVRVTCIDSDSKKCEFIRELLANEIIIPDNILTKQNFACYIIHKIYIFEMENETCLNLLNNKWLNLFEVFLKMPVFKDTLMSENLKIFFRDMITFVFKYKGRKQFQEKIMKIIIKSNISVLDLQFHVKSDDNA